MNNEKLMIANKMKDALLTLKSAPFYMVEAYLILKRTAS